MMLKLMLERGRLKSLGKRSNLVIPRGGWSILFLRRNDLQNLILRKRLLQLKMTDGILLYYLREGKKFEMILRC
jgi:hypothetical protein